MVTLGLRDQAASRQSRRHDHVLHIALDHLLTCSPGSMVLPHAAVLQLVK
jgi:hypothetical protein